MAEITTTVGGELSITDTDFPNLFNPHSGFFTIWVSANASGSPRLDIDDNNHNCITYQNICD